MINLLWNILILTAGCFVCACAGATVFRFAAGRENAKFFKNNFDRVETLCAEFLAGSGVMGTLWLCVAIIPGGIFGKFVVLLGCAAAVFMGGAAAWRDITTAWTHIKIIITQPQREMNVSVKILHWLILGGLAAILFASMLPPDNYKTVSEFLVAGQVAYNNGLTAAPGTEPFVAGGLLAEMNIAALMLFGGAQASGLLGVIYLLAGMMLASGVGRRAGLNYMDRWLLVLVMTAWGVVGLRRYGNFDAFASCGMAIAAFLILSNAPRDSRREHLLAGALLAWAVMTQYIQAAVLLPAGAAFAFSVFSRPQNNAEIASLNGDAARPTVAHRMGWLFAPIGAMIVIWLLKNIVLYRSFLPVRPDYPFATIGFLSAATLPFILLFVVYLKLLSGRKLVIGKMDCGKATAFMWQGIAFVIILTGVLWLIDAVCEKLSADKGGSTSASFVSYLGQKADPAKDRVLTLSPYRYFLDDKLIASSSDRKLFGELADRSDMDKWRQLWSKGYRWIYLTRDNTAFNSAGDSFIFSVDIGDGRTFTLDSAKLPPELGLEVICRGGKPGEYTDVAYKIVIRENAIIPDELAPVGK